jgi:hypothetical protein
MRYQVTINIDEVDDTDVMRGNIDSHQVVVLSDYEEAMERWNKTILVVENDKDRGRW